MEDVDAAVGCVEAPCGCPAIPDSTPKRAGVKRSSQMSSSQMFKYRVWGFKGNPEPYSSSQIIK